jgi:hypothetical protein
MTRLAPTVLTLTATLLFAACEDNLPTASQVRSGPQVTVPDKENQGAVVERDTGYEVTWDPARNFTWTLGLVSPLSLSGFCGGPPGAVVDASSSRLIVTTPNGVRHVRLITGGRVTFVLYEGTPPDVCDAPVFASGTAVATTNDNDLALTGNGTDSFGHRVVAMVTLADGTRAQVLIVTRQLIHQDQFDDDPIVPITVVDRFEIRPIGR